MFTMFLSWVGTSVLCYVPMIDHLLLSCYVPVVRCVNCLNNDLNGAARAHSMRCITRRNPYVVVYCCHPLALLGTASRVLDEWNFASSLHPHPTPLSRRFAFKPKVGPKPERGALQDRSHVKGCNCVKTKCLKKWVSCSFFARSIVWLRQHIRY